MSFNVFLIDDDVSITNQLSGFINNWAVNHDIEINMTIKNDLSEVIPEVICKYDVIILDVVIGNENGIEYAKSLREIGCKATIAFISNYTQYAINGYSVHAVSYILKPIKEDQINSLLSNVVFGSDVFSTKRIHISINGKDRFFAADSLLYIEAIKHQSVFHFTDNEEESYYYSFHDLEKQLVGTPLVRCHRSYIININYVRRMSYSEIQLYGINSPIPLGRAYANNVKTRLLWER